MNYPILSNAPILEAVLHINFESNSNILVDFEKFAASIKEDFHNHEKRFSFSTSFNFSEGTFSNSDNQDIKTLDSIVFFNVDKSKLIIISQESFSAHIVSEYSEWSKFKNFANEFWLIFKGIFEIQKQKRISLRYLNELSFKNPMTFEEHFKMSSFADNSQNFEIYGFSTTYNFYSPDHEAQSKVVIAKNERNNDNELVKIVLDVDVSKEVIQNVDIWKEFDSLREFKNDLFFNILTPETLEELK